MGVEQLARATPSSRDSLAAAGWECKQIGDYRKLMPRERYFSWLNPVPLWQARNDKLARWFGDPTNDTRRAWVKAQLDRGVSADFTVRTFKDRPTISFVLLGDTGEGDGSQYALVPGSEHVCADTDFMFICSDVIYPAGGIDEYEEKFFRPYRAYEHPIFAVPGNHDWYDDLTGFMVNFCGADPSFRPPRPSGPCSWWKRLLVKLFWRHPPRARARVLEEMRAMRGEPQQQQGRQPSPYMAIDAGPLLLLGLDTGITGGIDRDQGEWLQRISAASPKPKILLTGKPIYVDGNYHPGRIEGGGLVDEIVRAPEHNYIAAIGGDVHNYQRYPVHLPNGRVIQYIVSGGGGAFMNPTHTIPKITPARVPGVRESDFRCYPLRGDSLSIFSKVYDRRLRFGLGLIAIPADEAAVLMAERLHMRPTRESARDVIPSERSRRAFNVVFPRPAARHGLLQHYFSEFFDTNDPPMFKSFLRVDASRDEVTIRCVSATGCREQELEPPIEDAVRASLGEDGRWTWIAVRA